MDWLGMPRGEVEELLPKVRDDMMNPKIHAYLPLVVVYGQKPST